MHRILSIIALFLVSYSLYSQTQNATTPMSAAQIKKINALISQAATVLDKNPQEAVRIYSEALAIAPKEANLYILRGFAYLARLNNLRAAEADFTTCIGLAPKFATGHYYRGLTRLNMQNVVEAEKDVAKSIDLGMRNAEAYMNLGVMQAIQRKLQLAVESFTKGIRLEPKNGELYYERGNAFRTLGKNAEAIKDYDIALQLNPKNTNAYINRSASRGVLKDFIGAIADYTYLIANTPPLALNYYNRAYLYYLQKDYAKAIEDCSAALRLDSNAIRSRMLRINAYKELRKDTQALQELNAFLQSNPNDAAAFNNAGGQVQAFMKIEDFHNGSAFFIRAQVRRNMGDSLGACKDAIKSAILENKETTVNLPDFCTRNTLFQFGEAFPVNRQLFPRNAQDSAFVPIVGTVIVKGFDSAYVLLFKNGKLQHRSTQALTYRLFLQGKESVASAAVALGVRLHAELSEYSLHIGVKSALLDTIVAKVDSLVCGDAFFVSGQSNLVLGSAPPTLHNEYLRTFSMGYHDAFWGIAAANDNRDDYNVGGAALQMMERIVTQYRVPVCVINSALSASTIEQHFRNDSLPTNPFTWYGRMLWKARASGLAKAAKAMIWYQGESNQGAGYSQKFARLYGAWKQDYPAIEKIYAVQIHPSDCGEIDHASLREQQRNFPQQFPNIEVLSATALPAHDGCHFGNAGYTALGNNLYNLLARDLFRSADTLGIASPNLRRAYWRSAERKEVALVFATNDSLVLGRDTSVGNAIRTLVNDAFLLNGKPVQCSNIRTEGKSTLVVTFNASMPTVSRISYVPERCYNAPSEAPCQVYAGPWITTQRGIGALTFHNVAIESAP